MAVSGRFCILPPPIWGLTMDRRFCSLSCQLNPARGDSALCTSSEVCLLQSVLSVKGFALLCQGCAERTGRSVIVYHDWYWFLLNRLGGFRCCYLLEILFSCLHTYSVSNWLPLAGLYDRTLLVAGFSWWHKYSRYGRWLRLGLRSDRVSTHNRYPAIYKTNNTRTNTAGFIQLILNVSKTLCWTLKMRCFRALEIADAGR